jgi:cyclopropane fatty-acyl-phospholipid synthase-like methyltransferase
MTPVSSHREQPARAAFTPEQIQSFYDRNTPGFVAFGEGGALGAIHRAVWAPGVTTREQAFRYAEERILTLLPPTAGVRVVDLGCGVGASLCYLAGRRSDLTGVGVTLSPLQVRAARERIRRAALEDRLECLQGDFCDLPEAAGDADLVYAIESFVHGADPAAFFAHSRRVLKPSGLLVICDDFRRPGAGSAAAQSIARFRRGWQVNSLLLPSELREVARSAGFTHTQTSDLSPFLELNRPRDRVIAAWAALTGWLPIYHTRFGHLLGGSALQRCLLRGWVGYDFAVFQRVD